MGAFGILAQSIGGGGGTGGRANSISLQLGAKCTLPKVCEPAGGKPNWNLQATVGGAGGTGNDAMEQDRRGHLRPCRATGARGSTAVRPGTYRLGCE